MFGYKECPGRPEKQQELIVVGMHYMDSTDWNRLGIQELGSYNRDSLVQVILSD